MKIITYQRVTGDITARVEMPWSEANEVIAKREAHNGGYTIEDDGQPEPELAATTEDRVTNLEEALDLLLSGVTE